MKIGIVTMFKKTPNYGGALQAYALPMFLNKMGYKSEQIFFDDSDVCNHNKLSGFKAIEIQTKVFIWNLFKIIRHPLHYIKYSLRVRRMINFGMRITPHSKKMYHYSNIKETIQKYDMFIVGSDVVWSPSINSKILLLKFVPKNKKKISYAASFGTNVLSLNVQKRFKLDLSDYYAISVREKSMISVLENAIERKVEHCVDPTLLLDVEDWDKICSSRLIKESYVFSFFLGNNERAKYVALEYAKKKNKKLVNIPYLWKTYSKFSHFGDIRLYNVSPNDFISLIKYSDCIFTDSFHVCIFSHIYQRNFFAFRRSTDDERNIRIIDLLQLFDLTERYCGTIETETYEYCDEIGDIDYSKPFENLSKTREESINYLKKNCQF